MEADEDYDYDSAYGTSIASSTTSLRSAITDYEFHHGRRYHAFKSGQYAFPNDEGEIDRMDIDHQIFGLAYGGLHLAPLNSPQRILDLGTGNGIWAVDVADKYPTAQVIGIDLSPIQPKWVPPNVTFEVDDFEDDWTFGANRFDLVFGRLLLASVTDYPKLFKQAYDAVKPGGYFEFQDIDPETFCDDGTLTENHASMRWGKYFKQALEKMGRSLPEIHEYKGLIEAAGFVDVHEVHRKRPSNNWPKDPKMKEIGMWEFINHMEGIEAFTLAPFTRVLGWTETEAQAIIAQVRTEWPKRSLHGYQKMVALWGRKPE